MNWFVVPRVRPRPKSGNYSSWKPRIARNCRGQCVYCTISEGEYGGIDNFHVEHFRPKSRFKTLENDIDNLYVACAICNRFKSDDWPGEPDAKGLKATFLDPGVSDYSKHIRYRGDTMLLHGSTVAGCFMVERLFLNRQQLLFSRRYRVATGTIKAATAYLSAQLDEIIAAGRPGAQLLAEITKVSIKLNELQARLATASPYAPGATQRSKSKGRR